jgi:phosphate:Na+ symporter
MFEYYDYLTVIGGIALILYGIHISGINFQKLLGSHLEASLKQAAGHPLEGVLIGTGVTTAIHSSGTVAVMLIGLISGGFIGLADSVPVILGANIGSTFATQLATLGIGSMVFAVLAAGFIIHMASTRKSGKQIGETIIGFAFIFLGAQYVFDGIASLSGDIAFVSTVKYLTDVPLGALVSGAILTLLLHSASAASILTAALGASGVLGLPAALLLILGINLGSSLKVTQSALSGKNFSGRLALIHLTSNLVGVIVFLPLFGFFTDIAASSSSHPASQIANAHTFYNLISALIFLPFAPFAVRLFTKRIPAAKALKKSELAYLDRKLICTPTVSLEQVNRGAVEMLKISCEMVMATQEMMRGDIVKLAADIDAQEKKIDGMTDTITDYAIQISQQSLNHECKMKLYSLLHIVADIEHLCDHAETVSRIITDMRGNGSAFTEKAQRDLAAIYGKLRIMQNLIVKSVEEDNARLASEISDHENKVDEVIKKVYASHQERIDEGICDGRCDRYFSDILYNLERIGDHYDNIAYAVIDRVRQKDRD